MKTFLKKFLILIAIIFSATVVTNLSTATPTYADAGRTGADCTNGFLGLTTWDCNTKEWNNEAALKNNIWIIVGNISNNVVVIAAYLVLGYVIYGGYLYLLAAGDTNKTAAGKKTLVHAFTGLAIVLLAKIIVSSIHMALLHNSGAFKEDCLNASCTTANNLVTYLIQWVIGVAGIVAATFIVIGAISYITSSGEASKLQKAKNTILYALIGLAIVGLAEVITAFVSKTINDAAQKATTSIITTKELSYEK